MFLLTDCGIRNLGACQSHEKEKQVGAKKEFFWFDFPKSSFEVKIRQVAEKPARADAMPARPPQRVRLAADFVWTPLSGPRVEGHSARVRNDDEDMGVCERYYLETASCTSKGGRGTSSAISEIGKVSFGWEWLLSEIQKKDQKVGHFFVTEKELFFGARTFLNRQPTFNVLVWYIPATFRFSVGKSRFLRLRRRANSCRVVWMSVRDVACRCSLLLEGGLKVACQCSCLPEFWALVGVAVSVVSWRVPVIDPLGPGVIRVRSSSLG